MGCKGARGALDAKRAYRYAGAANAARAAAMGGRLKPLAHLEAVDVLVVVYQREEGGRVQRGGERQLEHDAWRSEERARGKGRAASDVHAARGARHGRGMQLGETKGGHTVHLRGLSRCSWRPRNDPQKSTRCHAARHQIAGHPKLCARTRVARGLCVIDSAHRGSLDRHSAV